MKFTLITLTLFTATSVNAVCCYYGSITTCGAKRSLENRIYVADMFVPEVRHKESNVIRSEADLDKRVGCCCTAASSIASSLTAATLQYLPLELLLQVTESLDIISIIRLSSVSSRLYEVIGISKSFWVGYCINLLRDEHMPPFSFNPDCLERPEIVKLATRTERIIRGTGPKGPQNLLSPHRKYFYLDHDADFYLHSWSIEQVPGGRWVLALAGHLRDDTLHLMCWDSQSVSEDDEISLLPVATIRVKSDSAPATHFELSQVLYDPILHVFICSVTIGVDEDAGSGFRVVSVQMECSRDRPPSFRLVDHTMSWPEDGPINSMPKFSGRWATLEGELPSDGSESIVWDSQTGQRFTYPLERQDSVKKVFNMITVTHFGAVIRVHGEAHVDHLQLLLSPVSSHGPFTTSGSFSAFASPEERETGKDDIGPSLTILGTIRLAHQETATLLWVRWYTVSIMIAASESGAFVKLPRTEDGWGWDERLAPLWTTYPPSHFNLSTTDEIQSDTGTALSLDDGAFILGVKPYNILGAFPQPTRALLALPPRPLHLKLGGGRLCLSDMTDPM
ncbi:hypothetical protein DL93DRAFT_2169413 [Clavulina sp. PMI_390]|nr:hypothetical protein DL93DRAFT_2169413 [Clavulina sp. PMI_390]